jgi:hypothetical protein
MIIITIIIFIIIIIMIIIFIINIIIISVLTNIRICDKRRWSGLGQGMQELVVDSEEIDERADRRADIAHLELSSILRPEEIILADLFREQLVVQVPICHGSIHFATVAGVAVGYI